MMNIVHITFDFAIASNLSGTELSRAAKAGFMTILNFRPDDEAGLGGLSGEAARCAAAGAGLHYHHIPANSLEILSRGVIDATAEALATLPKPMLGTCATGTRAAIAWAAATARDRSVESVLADLKAAGLDLDFLHEEIEAVRPPPLLQQHTSQPATPDVKEAARVAA